VKRLLDLSRWTAAAGLAAVTAGLACSCRRAGVPASRLYEKAGGFSYVTPDGWTRTRVAGIKYRIVAGPERDGVAPNLYIVDEDTPEPMGAYLAGFLARQRKTYPDFAIVGSNTLVTAQGLAAEVLDATRSARGSPLSLRFYFLPQEKRVVVVTCTWAASSGDERRQVFDDAMRSFRFED